MGQFGFKFLFHDRLWHLGASGDGDKPYKQMFWRSVQVYELLLIKYCTLRLARWWLINWFSRWLNMISRYIFKISKNNTLNNELCTEIPPQ